MAQVAQRVAAGNGHTVPALDQAGEYRAEQRQHPVDQLLITKLLKQMRLTRKTQYPKQMRYLLIRQTKKTKQKPDQ